MKIIFKKSILLFTIILILLLVNILSMLGNNFAAFADTSEVRYGDMQLFSAVTSTETVNYTRREDSKIETTNGVPLYSKHTELDNSCGATAGAIVVGFYDKYFENLIPNYASYIKATGRYKPADRVYIPALMEELYSLMKINIDYDGVREADCLDGLKNYVLNKNQSIIYSTLNTSSRLDETAYINAINNNKPVLLFCVNTEVVTEFSASATSEIIRKTSFDQNHIYVACGYYTVKYYNGNNNFRTDNYIKVACGVSEMTQGYIKVSSTAASVSNSWLNKAYAVTIS